MHGILSLGLGYLVGSLSPAAWVSRKKNVNLKKEGTGNLGATNTFVVMGKAAGFFVLIFDICKSFFSYKIAKLLFPHLAAAGLLAGIGAMLGHCYSPFLNFQGGKGLAAFGGLVLAHDPAIFALLLTLGIVCAIAANHGVALTISAAILFPILEYIRSDDPVLVILCAVASGFILLKHHETIKTAKNGEDIEVRSYLKNVFFKIHNK